MAELKKFLSFNPLRYYINKASYRLARMVSRFLQGLLR